MLTHPKLIDDNIIRFSDYQGKAVKAALEKTPAILANLLILMEDWDEKREHYLSSNHGLDLYADAGERLSEYYRRMFS